jgi:peroxiredoxin Q/BCP
MPSGNLRVGAKAPSFHYVFESGDKISLKDFLGRKVLIYFYPKDNTPGCTLQACSLRDSKEDFDKLEIDIIGISKDSEKSHRNFLSKYNLNFTLIPDSTTKIISKYGVLNERGSAKRTSFLIDEKGKIACIWNKVNTKEHAKEVLDFINS